MTDRCPKCNSVHIYNKRNIEAPWDSSSNAFNDGFDRPMTRADDPAKMLMECLDCDFSCLLSDFPEVSARMTKYKLADEELREKVYIESKIKILYEAGKLEEAEKIYLSKYEFTDKKRNIDEVYQAIIKSKNQSYFLIITISVLVLALLIWLLSTFFGE